MKKDSRIFKGLLLPLLVWMLPFMAFAQTGTITGKVTDSKGAALPGAAVSIKGTTIGGSTDGGGFYNIPKVKAGSYTLVFSFLGFKTAEIPVDVKAGQTTKIDQQMADDAIMLKDEVVVVGYGVTQSRDLTGSVVAIPTKSFQQGNFSTPEQMVVGKVAGVQITSNSGAPGAGSTIRIRGGTSIGASNDPLIVIDGVPIEGQNQISGASNPLTLINPDDIESFTVLKDASAAAIYGSRAANGVIIITTKQGAAGSKLNIEFSTTNGIKQVQGYVPVLSTDAFRQLVTDSGTNAQRALLSDGSTDWQREIYRLGITTDNNLSVSGGIKGLPYRLGLEYYHEDGILKQGNLNRKGMTLRLTPSFLQNHLKVDMNAKYYNTQNKFADGGAVGAAVTFDPTKPVSTDTSTKYGGYYEYRQVNGNPNLLAPRNPVGLLNQREDISSVNRFLGSALLDYKVHNLPELHLFLNLGMDYTRGAGTVFVDSNAASNFVRKGVNNKYEQTKQNQLIDAYFNYARELKGIESKFDLTGGYSFQSWSTESPAQADLNQKGDTISPAAPFPTFTENALMSFYGRLNYSFRGKYLLTATMRADGSSRFSPDARWGYFPSVALAWRMSDERFLKGFEKLSNLKLRLGYGVTGQQDIGSDYPYIANYFQSTGTAQYQFGNDFYYLLRPAAYDINIKWEETTSINVGLDYGFFNNRLYGTVDVYKKYTIDLLNRIPIPAGTNFSNFLLTNVGSMENTGIEIVANFVAIDNKRTNLEVGANYSYNKNELTKLLATDDPNYPGVLTGGISGGVGNTIQIHSVGYQVFTFYTYQQKYDESGKPLEGSYVDQNGDGVINTNDLVRHKGAAAPTSFVAFYGNFRHDRWSAGFSMRGELDRYVYNNVQSQYGNFFNVGGARGYLANVTESYNETKFRNPQYMSDYYVENASFLRMDNIYVGYNFGSVMNERVKVRVSAAVQNAFVITKYSGLDPEVTNGIDNNLYPRARVYTLNVNLNF